MRWPWVLVIKCAGIVGRGKKKIPRWGWVLMTLTKSWCNMLFCWLLPCLITFWIPRSWTVPHQLIMSPGFALPSKQVLSLQSPEALCCCSDTSNVFVLHIDVCVFRSACVFQFLGALRMLLNCQNHGRMLTWDYCQWPHYVNKGYFKKYKRCGIYFLGRGRGRERENVCVWMDLHCNSSHSSAGNDCQLLSTL